MKQLDLAPAPDLPPTRIGGVPPKLLHVTDPALGADFTIAIGPDSPWFELLPPQQSVQVVRHAKDQPAPAA